MSQLPASKERKIVVPQMKDRDAWHRFCFAAELEPVAQADAAANNTDNEVGENRVMKRKREFAAQFGLGTAGAMVDRGENDPDADADADSDEYDDDEDGGNVDGCEEDEMTSEAIRETWARAAQAGRWAGPEDVEPTTSVLLQLDQVLTQKLLTMQIDWLEDR
jgi:hypothetical protein